MTLIPYSVPVPQVRLKAPSYIQLADIKDFGRLVCALERAPLPSFSMKFSGQTILAVQTDVINGRSIIYYAKADKLGHYLAYRVSNGIEEVFPSDTVGNPTFVYSPILHVEKMPAALSRFARVDKKKAGYIPVLLGDLASLAKVAAYKTIYDEPPLPLFLFRTRGGAHALGAPMSISENDSISYFYYTLLADEPKEPFLRYTSQKAEQPNFSFRLDEHGYIYLKVIRLATDHPLVKVYE